MKIPIGSRVSAEWIKHGRIIPIKGVFKGITTDGYAKISIGGGACYYYCVPKSVRLLKKKPKQEIWVNEYSDTNLIYSHTSKEDADKAATKNRIRCTRFIKAKDQK